MTIELANYGSSLMGIANNVASKQSASESDRLQNMTVYAENGLHDEN